jgi:hypothetical protein
LRTPDPIPVDSIVQEYEQIARLRCDCGGSYRRLLRAAEAWKGKRVDLHELRCERCDANLWGERVAEEQEQEGAGKSDDRATKKGEEVTASRRRTRGADGSSQGRMSKDRASMACFWRHGEVPLREAPETGSKWAEL